MTNTANETCQAARDALEAYDKARISYMHGSEMCDRAGDEQAAFERWEDAQTENVEALAEFARLVLPLLDAEGNPVKLVRAQLADEAKRIFELGRTPVSGLTDDEREEYDNHPLTEGTHMIGQVIQESIIEWLSE